MSLTLQDIEQQIQKQKVRTEEQIAQLQSLLSMHASPETIKETLSTAGGSVATLYGLYIVQLEKEWEAGIISEQVNTQRKQVLQDQYIHTLGLLAKGTFDAAV